VFFVQSTPSCGQCGGPARSCRYRQSYEIRGAPWRLSSLGPLRSGWPDWWHQRRASITRSSYWPSTLASDSRDRQRSRCSDVRRWACDLPVRAIAPSSHRDRADESAEP
jgi:hypothetical protein